MTCQPTSRVVSGKTAVQSLASGCDAVGNWTEQVGGTGNLAESYAHG